MSTAILITIPTELEQKLTKRASDNGLPLEEYALQVLEREAAMPSIRELFRPVREEVESSGVSDDDLIEQIQEAVSEVRARNRG